jgi:hypothetical protein
MTMWRTIAESISKFWRRLRGRLQFPSTAQTKIFRVASRGHATAILRPGSSIGVNYRLDGRPVRVVIRTRYVERGYSVPVAGDLWMDAEGEAESVDTAAAEFSNIGRDLCAVISLVMNAAIQPLSPEIVLEVTPGLTRRPFFQRFVPADEIAMSSRFIDAEAVVKLIELLAHHPEKDRLTRAISQYTEALNHWKMGAEVPVLAHLFMGVEAIKTAMWRHVLRKSHKTKNELAAEWGYDPKRRLSLDQFLNETARARLVFKDDAVLKMAKQVSDSFEHGFVNAGKLYKPARESLMKTALYLRSAILQLAGVEDVERERLLDRYSKPRGLGSIEMYWRSILVGDAEHLGPPGGEYPMYHWQMAIEEVSFDAETDQYTFKPRNTFTAHMAEGLTFEGGTLEIWDGGTFTPPGSEGEAEAD